MNFQEELVFEANKLIKRFERYASDLRDDDKRISRRTGIPTTGNVLRPNYWTIDPSFDPFHVRANNEAIARSVNFKLRTGTYIPYNPIEYEVPKKDGSMRPVSVFTVADSAVSKRVYRSLMDKNRAKFSAYSYAYRNDLTVHDAIQNIGADLSGQKRMFIAEYDFSKYFQSIEHEHLWRVLKNQKFLLSPLERKVLDGFLNVENQRGLTYSRVNLAGQKSSVGIPQGTSISLFLANVAAWELDRSLERLGVGFARYADDTLIWSSDYSRICAAVEVLSDQSELMGSSINLKKSPGVSIFSPHEKKAELRTSSEVEFVGYRFTGTGIGLKRSVESRIKKKMSFIIWQNLLKPLQAGNFNPNRIAPNFDRDYYVMILQLRRYLYGDHSEAKIRRLKSQRAKQIHFRGLMSYFPLAEDIEQLKELDGWLLHTIFTSLQVRAMLFKKHGVTTLPIPHGLLKEELLKSKGFTSGGILVDLEIPSFVRVGKVIQKSARAFGPNVIRKQPGLNQYHYN